MDIKKLGRATKTKNGFLGLLLLACFAGNADAAQVRAVIETYNSIHGVKKTQTISSILKYLNKQVACDNMVINASQANGQLGNLIDSLVNTINYGNKTDAECAAEILHKIIFSEPNSAGRRNHKLHASLHFAENKSNTFNALEIDTGKKKVRHTVLQNYHYNQIFGRVLRHLTDEQTTILFENGQLKINMPLHYVCNNPIIYEVDSREFVRGLEARKQYTMYCSINVDNNGLIRGRGADTPRERDADGDSGSCYPIAK